MGTPRLVTDDVVARGAALVMRGLTVVDAARALGLKQVTLRARLRLDRPEVLQIAQANMLRRRAERERDRAAAVAARREADRTRWKARKITREQVEDASRRNVSGESLEALGKEYGMDPSALWRQIKRLGLPTAPRRGPPARARLNHCRTCRCVAPADSTP